MWLVFELSLQPQIVAVCILGERSTHGFTIICFTCHPTQKFGVWGGGQVDSFTVHVVSQSKLISVWQCSSIVLGLKRLRQKDQPRQHREALSQKLN